MKKFILLTLAAVCCLASPIDRLRDPSSPELAARDTASYGVHPPRDHNSPGYRPFGRWIPGSTTAEPTNDLNPAPSSISKAAYPNEGSNTVPSSNVVDAYINNVLSQGDYMIGSLVEEGLNYGAVFGDPVTTEENSLFAVDVPEPAVEKSTLMPANYSFEYQVKDDAGNDFGHRETKVGSRAEGVYYVVLPDGRKLTAQYVADEEGYKPQISYEHIGTTQAPPTVDK